MPRVKYLTKEDRYEELKILLEGKRRANCISVEEIAKKAGTCRATVYSDFKSPGLVSWERLKKYARALDISKEQLVSLLPW